MSLPGPPPKKPRPRGPLTYRFRYQPIFSRFHTIKVGADGPGREYTLRELVQIWTGQTLSLPPMRVAAGRRSRWQTVKLLRVMLLTRANPGMVARVSATFGAVANDPRLSQVGIGIGSEYCKHRKKHLDIDWFGPSKAAVNGAMQGGKPTFNWWQPSIDGAATEIALATELLHYLEASLGLGPSGTVPASWCWPRGIAPADPLAALEDPTVDSAVEREAESQGFDGVALEWWIGNSRVLNPLQSFSFSTQPTAGGKAFRIESPDCNPPDKNLA